MNLINKSKSVDRFSKEKLYRSFRTRLSSLSHFPGSAWMRKRLDKITPNASYENDFPSRRWPLILLTSLSGFVGILLVWSLIARSEISVDTQGRLRPSQTPTTSRAFSLTTSSTIFVKEGDFVQKGQPIMQLDDESLKSKLLALENRYSKIYVELQETSRFIGLNFPSDLPKPKLSYSLDLSVVRSSLEFINTQKEKVAQLEARLEQLLVKHKSLEQNIKLQSIIVEKHERLLNSGAIAELQVLQQSQKLQDLKSELESNQQDQIRTRAALRESGSEFTGRNNSLYSQRISELSSIYAEISSTKDAIRNSLLRAPLTGYVFRLAVKVPGVPVRPGEELFQIIPSELLTASVDVPARDIGFINKGMQVDVHIDSYPSSTYGVLKGTVKSIGRDSIEPTSPIQLPTYSIPVDVQLQKQSLVSKGKYYPLKPGMTARVSFNLRTVSVFRRLFDATSSILNPPPNR
ncbi:possible transporter for efflux [Prochlorococcus marinus str. MIT 9313]|uniref:Possible transporter for efflux n=1 Tax=Prochlorococcus marinus (strain MIT 9313) TaxID=74547 RepID=Q7V964_PROMM|nr:HlyD family efflux transporter periplasmic adaptor subunit [Prochlorococcus marinus]CAE20269.1 possible transporter for efflux [Prochlorococcus marinus str. MIT 9313]